MEAELGPGCGWERGDRTDEQVDAFVLGVEAAHPQHVAATATIPFDVGRRLDTVGRHDHATGETEAFGDVPLGVEEQVHGARVAHEGSLQRGPPQALDRSATVEDLLLVGPSRRQHVGHAELARHPTGDHVVGGPRGVEHDQIGAPERGLELRRQGEPLAARSHVTDRHPAHGPVRRRRRSVVVGDDGFGPGFAQRARQPADGSGHAAVTDQRSGVVVHDPHESPGGPGSG